MGLKKSQNHRTICMGRDLTVHLILALIPWAGTLSSGSVLCPCHPQLTLGF